MAALENSGVLTVTVEAAHDLKDPEWVGRQDPYCIIRVGGQTARTRTAVDGGRSPVWNETFRFSITDADAIEVVLKDDQLIEHDSTLGTASISLAKARETGTDHTRAAVLSPQHHRHPHGALSLSLQWEPSSCLQLQPDEPMQQSEQGQEGAVQEGAMEEGQGQLQQRRHHHGGGTPRERVDVVEFVAQRPVA